MVGGAGKAEPKGETASPKARGQKPHMLAAAVQKVKGKAGASRKASKPAEEVIPLEDGELSNF